MNQLIIHPHALTTETPRRTLVCESVGVGGQLTKVKGVNFCDN